jgi:putative heme-binding domain-containing protein
LARLDLESAAGAAAEVLPASSSLEEIGLLLDAFLTRKGGPDKLATALAAVELPADSAKLALRHMYSVGRSDASLSDVLGKAAGIGGEVKPPSPEEMRQLVAEVAAQGNAERGEQVFRRSDLSCLKCHAVSKAGGSIGPELSAVGSISPVDYLVNSIVDPNLAINEQFVTRVIITADGETFTGIVVDRDDVRVNLKDAAGKVVTIPVADIDDEAEGKSLMPQGLMKFLTHQELIDLVRFLSELGKPGPYAIRKTPTIQRWRILKQPPAAVVGESPDPAALKRHVFTAPADAWTTAYGKVGGDLPIGELTSPAMVFFLQGEIDVIRPGEIAFYTTPQRGVSCWIDGEPLPLSGITNLPRGRHFVTLRVPADREADQAVRMEVRKPANSKVQFDVVGGP